MKKVIILVFLSVFLLQCSTFVHKIPKFKIPVTFNKVSDKVVGVIEVKNTQWQWWGFKLGDHKEIDTMIAEELSKYPNAKGIQNFHLRPHKNGWLSFQLLPNPFAFIIGYLASAGPTIFGFSNRSIYVYGEVYE